MGKRVDSKQLKTGKTFETRITITEQWDVIASESRQYPKLLRLISLISHLLGTEKNRVASILLEFRYYKLLYYAKLEETGY
jgi:hypothetical protein